MLDKYAAAARLGREIPAAEDAIDEALARVTEVFQTSLRARREAGVPAATLQPSIMRLHKAMGTIIGAQGDMLRVHGEMVDTARELGIGDEPYCPPASASHDDEDRILRRVA